MKAFVARNPVLTFVLLTLGLQFTIVGIVYVLLPPGEHLGMHPQLKMLFRLRVFGPLLFSVGITAWLEGKAGLRNLFGSFLHWRVPVGWYGIAFIWKFLFAYLGIGAVIVLLGHWPAVGFVVPGFLEGWVLNFPFIVGIAFVEETSWMKFCLTRLQMKYTAFVSVLILGNCWGMWYLPMVIIHEGVPPGYPIPVFHGCMLALTILLAWAYNSTRSGTVLLTMQIVSNTAFFIVPVLPEVTKDPSYVTGFSLVFMAMAVLIVLVYGTKDLARRPRARWDEGLEADTPEEGGGPAVVPDPVPVRS